MLVEAARRGRQGPASSCPASEALEFFRARGVTLMFAQIKQSLHDFGVDFDVYFHENSLHESGAVETVPRRSSRPRARSTRPTAPGGSGPPTTATTRIASSSSPTATPAYIAGDIAYIRDKHERGADLCIYLLGADHHGYIARLKAAAVALGYDPD